MSSSHGVFGLPQRVSLTAQVAAAIRRGIAEGVWKGVLPSERRMCDLFQVSRPTIRSALHLCAKEGLFDIRQGLSARIRNGKKAMVAAPEKRLVCLITTQPIAQMGHSVLQYIAELRAHLLEIGFTSEVLVYGLGGMRAQQLKVETFLQHNQVFCCVLVSVNHDVQRWFAERAMPALVLGSCHPGVRLPSLDMDYRAVCRHAAGILLGKGHRSLAFLVPDSGVAGDVVSEQGFREGVEQSGYADARVFIVRHNRSARNITMHLDRLFDSARPPTALLVAKPLHVMMTVIYLLKRGVAVPDAVSLIARDQDYLFSAVDPPINHYEFPDTAFAQRLTRLMLLLINQGYLPAESNFILPKYIKGGTVLSREISR